MRATLLVLSQLLACLRLVTSAKQCQSDGDCISSATCKNGSCSNIFGQGCLREIAAQRNAKSTDMKRQNGTWVDYDFGVRTCNSDDVASNSNRNGNCKESTFGYTEVRFAPANWESSVFVSWIQQIILSEIYGVPVTIELGKGNSPEASFYDDENRFTIPDSVYLLDALLEAGRVGGDCSLTDQPCAHVLPEVWTSEIDGSTDAIKKGKILPFESNGIVGGIGIYIPVFTAERHLTLTSFRGLKGEENREYLAKIFKEPTTWADYCDFIDPLNCTSPNLEDDSTSGLTIAMRYPVTEDERSSYFVPNLYQGHFQTNEKNNCTSNPECRGHIIAPPCTWSTFLDNQLYWNNISLQSTGKMNPNNGYSYSQMVQIYKAANATKSDVIIWWWTPELLLEQFTGPSAFQRVTFPTTTEECLKSRANLYAKKCSEDLTDRRGDALSSCDYPILPLDKLMSNGLLLGSQSKLGKAMDSPAYTYIKALSIPEYALPSIFRQWLSLSDSFGEDPRQAVCEWVYDNIDELLQNAPLGYPRELKPKRFEALNIVGSTAGSVAMCATLIVAFLVHKWRNMQILRLAQIRVLGYMLCGYVLFAISAITGATGKSNVSCVIYEWSQLLGKSLVLMPILIKVSTINKLGRESRLCKRATINPNYLTKNVTISIMVVLVYLLTWTVLDLPTMKDHQFVMKNDFDSIVEVSRGCTSISNYWRMAAFAFECIILFSTLVLSYQSRDIIEKLNESNCLMYLVYTHSAFLLMRLTVYSLGFMENVGSRTIFVQINSILLALETIASIVVYFVPQFIQISKANKRGANNVIVVTKDEIQGRAGLRNYARKRVISGVNIPAGGIPQLTDKSRRASISGVNIPAGGIPQLTDKSRRASSSCKSSPRHSANGSHDQESSLLSSSTSNIRHAIGKGNVDISSLKERACQNAFLSSIGESSIYMGEDEEESDDEFVSTNFHNSDGRITSSFSKPRVGALLTEMAEQSNSMSISENSTSSYVCDRLSEDFLPSQARLPSQDRENKQEGTSTQGRIEELESLLREYREENEKLTRENYEYERLCRASGEHQGQEGSK